MTLILTFLQLYGMKADLLHLIAFDRGTIVLGLSRVERVEILMVQMVVQQLHCKGPPWSY